MIEEEIRECDLKFGEQITLDGAELIPLSLLDKVRTKINEAYERSFGVYNSSYREGLDKASEIIDKYMAKLKDTEL